MHKRRSVFAISSCDRFRDELRVERQRSNQIEAKDFLETILNTTLDSDNLHHELQDGILLCRLINHLEPGTVTTIGRKNEPFVKMTNIDAFLQAARKLGLQSSELFQTVDLYEAKDMPAVVNTILSLARLCSKRSVGEMPVSAIIPSYDRHGERQAVSMGGNHMRRAPNPMSSTGPSSGHRHVKSIFAQTTVAVVKEPPFTAPPPRYTASPVSSISSSANPLSDEEPQLPKTPSCIILDAMNDDIIKTKASGIEMTPQAVRVTRKRFSQSFAPVESPNEFHLAVPPCPTPSRSTPIEGVGDKPLLARKESSSVRTKPLPSKSEQIESSQDKKRDMVRVLVQKERGSLSTQFLLGNCIGKGQFGAVYRALDMHTGQIVAIKRIETKDVSEEQEIMQEVELLRDMTNPNIVQYIGFARDDQYLNIVLEYVENGSLLSTLKAFGSLPEKLVASYTHKILNGLVYLHDHSVVHCDLKAANILTTKTGDVKLTDFGVSLNLRFKTTDDDGESMFAGTPNWMAPEVIELKGVSVKSDVWSLGCTIVEMLTGKPPYADMIAMSALYHIVEDDHPPLPTSATDVLRDFLKLCFQKSPDDRPSAKELLRHPWMIPMCSVHPPRPLPLRSSAMRRRSALEPMEGREWMLMAPSIAAMSTKTGSVKIDTSSHVQDTEVRNEKPCSHQFIKTHFEKAVICKVCHESVKRKAAVCEVCTLICHERCKPPPMTGYMFNEFPSTPTSLPLNDPGTRLQRMLARMKKTASAVGPPSAVAFKS